MDVKHGWVAVTWNGKQRVWLQHLSNNSKQNQRNLLMMLQGKDLLLRNFHLRDLETIFLLIMPIISFQSQGLHCWQVEYKQKSR